MFEDTSAHIEELCFVALLVKKDQFDVFFQNRIYVIATDLCKREDNRNKLHLPSTTPTSIMKLANSGDLWNANIAKSSAFMMELRIALLRLSARFISDTCLQDENCIFNLYTAGLDRIIFEDEQADVSLDPDSLIDVMKIRLEKINQEKEKFKKKEQKAISRQRIPGGHPIQPTTEDLLPEKYKSFLSDTIQKIRAGHIAMPKPFGTKARLEAEEEARLKVKKKTIRSKQKGSSKSRRRSKKIKKSCFSKSF